jgi:RNA polymerase sigma-70 factor (ECF subfamily)
MGVAGEPPDGELVLLAKDGNMEAFNSLVDRYQRPVYSLCYRILGRREPAEDAAQEAFLSAFRAISSFEGGSFRSWLFRIAANQCRDELRRERRRLPAGPLARGEGDDEEPIDVPDPHAADATARLLSQELGAELEAMLMELPFEQRQAVVLIDVYELAYEEVAGLTATSVGTIKSRVHRGRERLRKLVNASPELRVEVRRLEQ